ncbi:hypothetical protein KIF59_05110 [Enterobacter cloacae subsp. cloacae]|nr:hypothetical protein [Enterobacter cloacae subsp. cloacae]
MKCPATGARWLARSSTVPTKVNNFWETRLNILETLARLITKKCHS